jgi:hypothetical protein
MGLSEVRAPTTQEAIPNQRACTDHVDLIRIDCRLGLPIYRTTSSIPGPS